MMDGSSNGYGDYSNNNSYASSYGATGTNGSTQSSTMRRRTTDQSSSSSNNNTAPSRTTVVQQLDFMFPKVEAEYTIQTDKGAGTSLIATAIILILALAETASWARTRSSQNHQHIAVDTSIGKRMRVNLDITFPAVACEDLHMDIIDVAGDSQLDVEDTIVKKRLNRHGIPMGREEIEQVNKHKAKQVQADKLKLEPLPDDYCGSCFGAQEEEGECCNSCDALIEAYKKKRWRVDLVVLSAEQCIREGRDKAEAKPKLKRGEGCNMRGYFMMNRVGGNFHMAMGEGVERDGRHIHKFNPEEMHHFNASHTIHHLSFGPEVPELDVNGEQTSLNGVSKIVQREHGTTGLFQYFIKVVPTSYVEAGKGGRDIETNRFFFTERFRPLMKEYVPGEVWDDDDDEPEEDSTVSSLEDVPKKKEEDGDFSVVHAGHGGRHGSHRHHDAKHNSVLPGVFFIYEIYPFEVEISRATVPLSHLLIRLMATVGGVMTIARWADSFLFSRDRRRNGGGYSLGGA